MTLQFNFSKISSFCQMRVFVAFHLEFFLAVWYNVLYFGVSMGGALFSTEVFL